MANRVFWILGLASGVVVFTGCSLNFPGNGNDAIRVGLSKPVDVELQSVCDVSRTRAREQLLKKIKVKEFRNVALKISQEISRDEIADLVRLQRSRNPSGSLSPEGSRGRSQLIDEIYTGAILRAGFKLASTEVITGTDLSYKTGVDSIESGDESYTSIVLGRLTKDAVPAEGQFSQLSLSANPDQTRYYVELYELSRFETQSDGTQVPVYMTSNLFDAVDSMVPHYCGQTESALDLREFNTISGLGGDAPAAPVTH